MSDNPFVLPASEYKRDIDVMEHYVNDTATYLSIMTGKAFKSCVDFVRRKIGKGGEFEFKDPKIMYLERQENGDREQQVGTLSVYLKEAIERKELIAPTMTTYLNPNEKLSILVEFLDMNVKLRGKAKKEQFAARGRKDKKLEIAKKIEQTYRKLSNNSMSGAHVSASTPMYNKTAHNTLTSNCRTTSGYGNANNEKFLAGNRHYWCPDVTRNNIISIITHSNYELIEKAMAEFGIRHPTVEETIECVRYSAQLYWRHEREYERINLLISKLTPIQRSAFVYTGDLFHLMKLNQGVVRTMLDKLSARIDLSDPRAVPSELQDEAIKNSPDDNKHLAALICISTLKGKGKEDLKQKLTPDGYGAYVSTANNVGNVVEEYRSLIRAFWVTPNVPASVAYFPDSIRRVVVTSDTDSTIFTVQDWVVWYKGKLAFDEPSIGIAASLVFLTAQSITHILARMSANFGIEEKRIHQIAMKNEFFFDIFTPTQVAKHYYALQSTQEGDVFGEYELEIKGVHLKSSKAPKIIMKQAKDLMSRLMNTVVEGKLVSLDDTLKEVADLERKVIESVRSGKREYYLMAQIKNSASYTRGIDTPDYQQYLMWQQVFAPKYGEAPYPPFSCCTISVELDTPSATKKWLANMQDRELATRFENWIAKSNKKHLGSTFKVPIQCFDSVGMPPEILDVVDIRKTVINTVKVFYIILESLGYYCLNDKLTRLVSDHY
jgi:hypothetical protein